VTGTPRNTGDNPARIRQAAAGTHVRRHCGNVLIQSRKKTNGYRTTTRMIKETTQKNKQESTAGVQPVAADIVLHETDSGGSLRTPAVRLKNRGIVHRAMQILGEWKFVPARIICAAVPVDILAVRQDVTLLVQVISSKQPVPCAKTLVRCYRAKIQALRTLGTTAQFRKLLMAWSRPCGWKYYDVLPGGLKPAWDLAAAGSPQS